MWIYMVYDVAGGTWMVTWWHVMPDVADGIYVDNIMYVVCWLVC